MNAEFVTRHGGSLKRTSESVASVSFWYIPGGANYDQATVVACYFDDLEMAKAFQRKYSMPPELASLILVESI